MIALANYTCSICRKSFEKRTSQVRHISYCRKSKSRGRSRKRACLSCTKAKTHCDAFSPSCSRCAAKNLTCHYERPQPPISDGTAVTPRSSSDESITLEGISALSLDVSSQTDIQLFQAGQNGAEIPFTGSLEQREPISALSDIYGMPIQDPITSGNAQGPPQLSYSDPDPTTGFLDTDVEEIFMFNQLLPKPPRGFFVRAMRNHQLSLSRKYMITTLRSYPFTMLPGKSQKLPAFIHPQCLSYGSKDGRLARCSLSSPLENCLAIMQMWAVKNEANAAFIWKTIRMEQERLFSECSQYDDWTTVASLQAITVYILLRLSEHDDEHMDFDLPLVRTMIKLALHSHGIGARYAHSPDGGDPSWEAWVLVESLGRTLIVLFIVDTLFDYAILLYPHTCDGSDLLRLPLPCGRDLWQARSRSDWQREYALKAAGKQLTYGDLLDSRFRTDRTLDSWLEQLDDFGTLVMAAASLGDG